MQYDFLEITIGLEFFLLVGYVFYLLFRSYSKSVDRVSMMKWMSAIIILITLGLMVSIILVATRMSQSDLVIAVAILLIDSIGIYLLIDDTNRLSKIMTQSTSIERTTI
ncbi:MAG: hypothetical protein ACFFCX_11605 [Candidatus Sifarchaeia archaeon]